MAARKLTPEAFLENQRALMLAAGIAPEEAAQRLGSTVLLTVAEDDDVAASLAAEIEMLLERTLMVARALEPGQPCAVELVVGPAARRTEAPCVGIASDEEGCTIGPDIGRGKLVSIHPLLDLIVACYACGAALYRAVCRDMPNAPPDQLRLHYEALGIQPNLLAGPIDIGTAYMTGAGAIGNGFLWAARHVNLRGLLNVVDDDIVSSGNLQRQIWFDTDDLEKPKASRLCARAQSRFPDLELKPRPSRLQDLPERGSGPWLERLIVAVDSRQARRSLQKELPREVFDASTTGTREIVLHTNRQLSGLACMGCIYPKDQREISERMSMASHLGIEVADMDADRIAPHVATKIVAKYPQLDPTAVDGMAFETLYKSLCSSQQLQSTEGPAVVAPFAFVSVLAGAMLLLEVVDILRSGSSSSSHNDWRISPWHPPLPQKRRRRSTISDCECCNHAGLRSAAQRLWGPTRPDVPSAPDSHLGSRNHSTTEDTRRWGNACTTIAPS
ncbi:ThiF family adenylyltransferase [Bradyrhizobium sp. 17]|uniref:ThiF family adenylyltransferase n=1 Tax=Bradyrhizobium sp. 17 TaxID=2782649 RepID=UPI0021122F91|nr:ThiF family adenylyltransferase [Bradyrhizobium sp. 17]MCK1519381.1 ThiF family adenylyltransferase [Bradyrhizobium sp. 17]